jgi:transposase
VQLHFTPTYSSWLNQVEIWFAKIPYANASPLPR